MAAGRVTLLSALSACSLLNPLDGFVGSADPVDAGPDTPVPLLDGGEAGRVIDGGQDTGEGGPGRAQLYAAAVLADGPLGYWRLEETTLGAAKDETGRYEGRYLGSPAFGEPGVAGSRAVKLPTSTQSRMLVDSADFRFAGTAPHTIELWAQPGTLKDYQWLASTEVPQTTSRNGWSLLANADGRIQYEVWTNQQTRGVVATTTKLQSGALHHLVVTYSGMQVTGYVDGVLEVVFPTTGSAPDVGTLAWGCRSDLGYCLDDWTIDELAIYAFALPEARVKAHYALGK